MSLPVFIFPDLASYSVGDSITLDGAEGRHAVTVKRTAVGERVALSDGAGVTAVVEVTAVEGKEVLRGSIVTHEREPLPQPAVTVVQAIPKAGHADLAVDLATQAGADAIVAWAADRCVAKWDGKKIPKALKKWQDNAVAAAKQSRRPRVPEVSGPLTTKQLAARIAEADLALVLHEDATESLKNLDCTAATDMLLIIGPEGGIGPDELDILTQAGARPVKLGPQVLRTSSAAMVALAAVGALTERW